MTKVKYIGAGKYVQGVPARDMTMKEWRRFAKWKRDVLVANGLYELPQKKKKKETAIEIEAVEEE